jgi:hypothetical protein
MEKEQQLQKIEQFVRSFTEMEIGGVKVYCPYFMNRLCGGSVVFRGVYDGKGSAEEIRKYVLMKVEAARVKGILFRTPLDIQKLAKRERIGIDCSGFAYRMLEFLASIGYRQAKRDDFEKEYPGGIRRTNADTLTSSPSVRRLKPEEGYQTGDLIRMMRGHHVLVVNKITDTNITYVHASSLRTKMQGVHENIIVLTYDRAPLEFQKWEEETRYGENFGKKYYQPQTGDGVFRLRFFDS